MINPLAVTKSNEFINSISESHALMGELRTKQFMGSDTVSFTTGRIAADADLTLLEMVYQDVSGTTLTIDPGVGTTALVLLYATFNLVSGGGPGSGCDAHILVDGVETGFVPGINGFRNKTLFAPYSFSLSSGTSHTVVIQSRAFSGSGGTCYATGTGFLYWLYRS